MIATAKKTKGRVVMSLAWFLLRGRNIPDFLVGTTEKRMTAIHDS